MQRDFLREKWAEWVELGKQTKMLESSKAFVEIM